MTTTPPVSGSQQTAGSSSQTALDKPSLDYDAFLKLLLAQMQNQDPLQPIDSTEYVAQLATFSNVEQGLKMNQKLDQLLFQSNISQASGLVGKSLLSADGTIGGTVAAVKIDTSGATAILTDGTEVPINSGVTIGEA